MQGRTLFLFALALATVFACKDDNSGGGPPAGAVCAPGSTQSCVGPGGCKGGQSCLADGSGWGVCDCGGTGGAGATIDTGGGADAVGAGTDAMGGASGGAGASGTGGSSSVHGTAHWKLNGTEVVTMNLDSSTATTNMSWGKNGLGISLSNGKTGTFACSQYTNNNIVFAIDTRDILQRDWGQLPDRWMGLATTM